MKIKLVKCKYEDCKGEMKVIGYSNIYGLLREGGIKVLKCVKCKRIEEKEYVKRSEWGK